MQISHRVLNVLFLNHTHLFGGVLIKRWVVVVVVSGGGGGGGGEWWVMVVVVSGVITFTNN